MMGYVNKSLKLSALCVAIACVQTNALALENLEKLDDDALADSTGEGIAFLPENAVLLLRGAGAGTTESITTLLTDRSNDTGYINYIPVGPLTNAAATSGAGKADVYLYGLAISKGDNDLNSRLNATDPLIRSWGTADNPWLFKVETETGLPNFAPTGTDSVTYLALEAPLHHLYTLDYTDNSKDVSNNIPTTGETGADAYNLKLGLWADAFVLDPTKSATDSTRFNLGGTNRANRLRLQAIWDGLSINGSDIKLFQTMGGATNTATNGNAKDTAYNHTLGLAGVLRFNSGDTRATSSGGFKANITTTGGGGAATSSTAGWVNRYSPHPSTVPAGTTTAQGTTNCTQPGGTIPFVCQYQIRSRTTTINNAYTNGTWSAPNLTNAGILRFSTQESGTVQGVLDSPATGVGSGSAPTFDANEGVFLYGANINLVLGSLYQPLILNKDSGSNNLVLEIAAIPNKADIYKKIYTAYTGYLGGATASDYSGSTCSVYFCGTPIEVNNGVTGVKTYQGNTATHSSISIGSTEYNPNTGLMTAYKGIDAVGVSFGALPIASTNPTGQSYYYYELQNRERRRGANNRYRYCLNESCSSLSSNSGTNTGLRFDNMGAVWKTSTGTSLYNPTVASTGYTWAETTGGSTFVVPSLGAGGLPQADAAWNPTTKQWESKWDGTTWTPTTTLPAASSFSNSTQKDVLESFSKSQFTNLGSAVIDGMLIQHMKITTKGL